MQVIDVTVVNKICNGKFYLDKKLIKVSLCFCLYSMLMYILDGCSLILITLTKQLEPIIKEETTGFYWLALVLSYKHSSRYYVYSYSIAI